MSFNLGNFLRGAANDVGNVIHTVENVGGQAANAVNNVVHPQAQPQPQQQQQHPNFIQQAGNFVGNGLGNVGHALTGAEMAVVNPIAHATTNLVKPVVNNTADFSNQLLHGIGDTGIQAVTGLTTLGGHIASPVAPGANDAVAKFNQGLNDYQQSLYKGPNTKAGDAGYIAGNALGMIGQMLPAEKGVQAANAVSDFLKAGSSAPKIVQQTATKGLQAIGGGLGYTAVSGDTSPQNAAQNIALGAGLEAVPPAIRAGAAGAGKAVDATKALNDNLNHINDNVTTKLVDPGTAQGGRGFLAYQGAASGYDKLASQGKPVVQFPDAPPAIEVSDKNMKIKDPGAQALANGQTVALQSVMDHPQMQKQYPGLFNEQGGVNVKVGDAGGNRATFDPNQNLITIDPKVLGNTPERVANALKTDSGKQILGHELSHTVDKVAGVQGVSPEAVQASLQSPAYNRAQNTVKTYQDGYNQLKSNLDKGLITPDQFKADPHVQTYEAAQKVAAKGQPAQPIDTYRAYNTTPAEQRANLMGSSRMNMSQKEIDKNPIAAQPVPYRLPGAEPGLGDTMAAMKDPFANPEKVLGRQPTPAEQAAIDAVRSGQDPYAAWKQSYQDRGMMFGGHKKAEASVDRLLSRFNSNEANRSPVGKNPLERGLTSGIKGSPNFSPELQKAVSSEYTPFTDKAALAAHEDFAKQPLDAQNQQALAHLSADRVVGKQETVNFGKTIQALDAAGRTDEATTIHNLLAKRLTDQGQGTQGASLLYRRTPEGITNAAMTDLRTAKVEVSPELQAQIHEAAKGVDVANKAHFAAIEAAKGSKYGSPLAKAVQTADNNRAIAEHNLSDLVNKQVQSDNIDKGLGLWKSGLIDGTQTASKVGMGYVFNTPVEVMSKLIAAAADRVMSLGSGERHLTATPAGVFSGVVRGAKAIPTKLRTGLDLPGTGGFETGEYKKGLQSGHTQYKHGITNVYANLPGRLHASISKLFGTPAYDNTIADLAHAAAKNKGLQGAEKEAFINDFRINPPDEAKIQAQKDAAYQINQQTTLAGKWASKMQQSDSPVGRLVGNIVIPFTRIPSALGVKGILDYTPLGLTKEVVSQLYHHEFDQRSMAMAIGRTAAGSTVGLGLGALLNAEGRMTGAAPSDTKQKAVWDAEGKQPNSILIGGHSDGQGHIIGGHWISLNALSAIGITLSIGGAFNQGLKDHNGDVIKAGETAMAAGGKTLAAQPFLQGVTGIANALNDPTRYAQTIVDSTVGSVIPSIVATAARAMDSTVREINGVGDALKNRIPVLHNTLQPKQDIYGNPIKEETGITGMFDPFRTLTNNQSDPVSQELDRLYNTKDAAGKNLGAISEPDKKIKGVLGGSPVTLTPEQRTAMISSSGPQIHDAIGQLINSPAYQGMTDTQKQGAIQNLVDSIRQGTSAAQKVADLPKGASANAKVVAAGGKATPLATTSDPKMKYQQDLALFNQQKAAGTLDAAKVLTKQQSLAKEAVTSKYSKDVVDFYNLSNAQKNQAFKQDPQQAQALYNQAAQLASDLKAAGLSSKTVSTKVAAKKGTRAKATVVGNGVRVAKSSTKKTTVNYTKLLASATSGIASAKEFTALRNLVKGSGSKGTKLAKTSTSGSGKLKKVAVKPTVSKTLMKKAIA